MCSKAFFFRNSLLIQQQYRENLRATSRVTNFFSLDILKVLVLVFHSSWAYRSNPRSWILLWAVGSGLVI